MFYCCTLTLVVPGTKPACGIYCIMDCGFSLSKATVIYFLSMWQGSLLKKRKEETWTEQVTCTKWWGKGWIPGPHDSRTLPFTLVQAVPWGLVWVELAGRDIEMVRNSPRILRRGHWGRGRLARAMGEDWGRGRAEGSYCLAQALCPKEPLCS